MRSKPIAILAAVALLAPVTADAASVSIEALYGPSWPPAADFSSAISGVNSGDVSEDTSQIAGGTILLNFGLLELGAIIDATVSDDRPKQTAIGALAGIRLGDKLRLDLLGEIGGQRYGSVFEDSDVVTGSTSEQWLMYVGLRPGIAYRFGSNDGVGVILGLWGYARWDLTDESVPVTAAGGAPSPGEVELGGTTIGATLRVGLEF
jgi:hypothetical protein